MRNKRWLIGLLVFWMCSSAGLCVSNYNIMLPSYPPGGTIYDSAAMNDLNQIVGPFQSGGPRIAYLWEDGNKETLPFPQVGMEGCYAVGINNNEHVVGGSTGNGVSYLWNGIQLINLGNLGGNSSTPYALNEADQVVGSSALEIYGNTTRPFLWQNNTMISLGSLGGNIGRAYDINNHGVVVGYSNNALGNTRAFIYRNGIMTDLGTLGGSQANAVAINDANEVIGWSEIASGYQHAFILQNGTMTDLGTLGGNQSQAFDINNSGQIIGWAETATGYRPLVIWENGVAVRLNSLIAADSGWELVLTGGINMDEKPFYCINNNGAILGTGFVNGNSHSFLMMPREDDFFLHDSNYDGSVNLQDFVQMSKEWMK